MKQHFTTRRIEKWIDGDEWTQNFTNYDNLTNREEKEIKDSLNQIAAPLLLVLSME